MSLRGVLADLMAMLYPKLYQNYVTTNQNEQTFIYVKVIKALYGIFNSTLFFYNKPVKYLEDYVLNTNP